MRVRVCVYGRKAKKRTRNMCPFAQRDFSPHCLLAETLPALAHLSQSAGHGRWVSRTFRTGGVSAFSESPAHRSDSELTFIPRSLSNMLSKYLLTVTSMIQAYRYLPASHGAAESGQSCDPQASFLPAAVACPPFLLFLGPYLLFDTVKASLTTLFQYCPVLSRDGNGLGQDRWPLATCNA